jgi:hypothetical protein
MIAKSEEHGRHWTGFGDFFWYHIFGPLIGFSYHPWNALYDSFFIIILGHALFRKGERCDAIVPTKKDAYVQNDQGEISKKYPTFRAFPYSLETFVPLVKLGVAEYGCQMLTEGKKFPGFGNY